MLDIHHVTRGLPPHQVARVVPTDSPDIFSNLGITPLHSSFTFPIHVISSATEGDKGALKQQPWSQVRIRGIHMIDKSIVRKQTTL